MTTLEITLIIIGVVFLIGSFMVNDKLSHKDLDKKGLKRCLGRGNNTKAG